MDAIIEKIGDAIKKSIKEKREAIRKGKIIFKDGHTKIQDKERTV